MPDLLSLEPVAVTGATGFIASHLVPQLVAAGCQPILLSRSWNENVHFAALREHVRWVEMDLTRRESFEQILQKEKPATLFHLGGVRPRTDARDEAVRCDEINFHATVSLLEAAMLAGVRRIVIMGSSEEYGNQSGPLHEGLSLRPATPYGVSKAKATARALEMHSRDGCPVVVLRPFSVYGPAQPPDMFVAEAVDCAVRTLPFKMSHGEQKRDLVFVADVVRGLINAAYAPGIEGLVINLGTGKAHRLRDVAERIWKMTETQAPLLIGHRHAAPEKLYDTWGDITLARRLLGWEPVIDLDTGLRQTIGWAREQLEAKVQLCQAT
jgi:UDP-glucose 4-epimerase